MDAQERMLYVQILAQMLIADGVLADDERTHLEAVMDSLSMSKDERRDALAGVSIDSPVEERVKALGAEPRKGLLAEVEKAMHAGGEITNSQAYFLERVRKLLA